MKFLVFIFFLFFSSLIFAAGWNKQSLSDKELQSMLAEPGVKLIAVDFFATWCEPCKKAIPKWRALQEKYRSKGLRLVVVSVKSENGACAMPEWNPDKIICDEEGEIAEKWDAGNLPQAFLWSWQGNLLVSHGDEKTISKVVEDYFRTLPNILVETPVKSDGKVIPAADAKEIRDMIRGELRRTSKVEVVLDKEEIAKNDAVLKQYKTSQRFDENMQCELGQELPANSRLKTTVSEKNGKKSLYLELLSLEKGCLIVSSKAPVEGDNYEAAIVETVSKFLKQLLGDVKMPQIGGDAGFQTGKIEETTDSWNVGKGDQTIIKFNSLPQGASVLLNGKMLCQQTPCSKMVPEGRQKITMQKEFYKNKSEFVEIKKGIKVEMNLENYSGLLTIETFPSNVPIKLDGEEIGKSPIIEKKVAPGPHQVEAESECYLMKGEKIIVENKKEPKVVLDLKYRESAIRVTAVNKRGDDITAEVFVDDQNIGTAPGTFKIPLCSQNLKIVNGSEEFTKVIAGDLQEKQVLEFNPVFYKAPVYDPEEEAKKQAELKRKREELEEQAEDSHEKTSSYSGKRKVGKTIRPYSGLSYGLWIGGAVSLGTGLYFNSKKADLNKKADESYDPSNEAKSKKYLDDAKSAGTMRNVFYGLGAAGIVTGTILFFITEKVPPVALYVDDKGFLLSYNFKF